MPAISDEFKNDMEEAFKDVKPEPAKQAEPNPPSTTPPGEPQKPAGVQPSPPAAPAAAAPAKPTETDPDDEIISGKRSPKSEDFKRVKSKAAEFATKYETAEQERKRLEKELSDAKSKPIVDPVEVETLRKELAQSKEQFSTVALEFMPEFNAKYQTRVDKVKGDLKGVVGEKSDQIFEVLALPNSKAKTERLSELLEDMDERTKFKVYRADDDLEAIQNERNGELKASQEKLNTIVEGRKATAKQRQEQLDAAFDSSVAELVKDNPLYQQRDGDNDWNESVKQRIQIAKDIYSGKTDMKQFAKTVALGLSNNLLVAAIQAEKTRVKELEEQLKGYQSTNPGVRGGGGGGKVESKGFAQDFEEAMKG